MASAIYRLENKSHSVRRVVLQSIVIGFTVFLKLVLLIEVFCKNSGKSVCCSVSCSTQECLPNIVFHCTVIFLKGNSET